MNRHFRNDVKQFSLKPDPEMECYLASVPIQRRKDTVFELRTFTIRCMKRNMDGILKSGTSRSSKCIEEGRCLAFLLFGRREQIKVGSVHKSQPTSTF